MNEYRPLIQQIASAQTIDPVLVEALITVESGGNRWAWNPEPEYRYLWDVRQRKPFRPLTFAELAMEAPPADFPCLAGDRDQEFWAQQASWGLMQVMGAVARELGFAGPYLTQLGDPETNLTYGCMRLSALLKWSKGVQAQALAAYNGGKSGNSRPPYRNEEYAAKVLAALKKLRALS